MGSLERINCSDNVLHDVAALKVNVLRYVRIVSDSAITKDQDTVSDSQDFECGSSSGEEAEFDLDVLNIKQSPTFEDSVNSSSSEDNNVVI